MNARAEVRAAIAARVSAEFAERVLPAAGGDDGGACERPPAAIPWAELAAAWPTRLRGDQRKQRGAWFTPMELARPTAARALAPLLGPGRPAPRIVDPAVGGGTFLLAAFAELRAAGSNTADALGALHGVDQDDAAAALALLAVWQAAEAPFAALDELATRIHAGDGLLALPDGGFDAVLTNPPWETLQAHAAAREQAERLRGRFHHQGPGKLYTYRLFAERSLALLRPGGRYGMVLPASLWFDRGARPLRRLLLDDGGWEWLYGFENRRRIFAIDGRYRFGVVVGTRGIAADTVRVAFGATEPAQWAAAAPAHTDYPRTLLTELSPHAETFVEVDEPRDLALLRTMHAHGEPLAGPGARWVWRQGDFNMTGDVGRFVARDDAEAAGWRRAADGTWRRGGGEVLLPLLQGAMVHDLHPNAGAHAGGRGFATRWEPPAGPGDVRPAYLVRSGDFAAAGGARVVLRALSNATNARTALACLVPPVPCGNSLGVLLPRDPRTPLRDRAALAAVLGSLPFDHALRLRMTGQNVNGFVLADCVVPRLATAAAAELAAAALALCALSPWHAELWAQARAEGWAPAGGPIADPAARRPLHVRIDALVGAAFGLTADDVAWLVRDCLGDAPRRPRGFWRVDRDLPTAERRPVRWLAAAREAGNQLSSNHARS